MEGIIREPPDLFSTERQKIESIIETGTSSLLIKRTHSVRFVPIEQSADLDVGGSEAFPVVGSEVGGGQFKEFQSKVSRGFFSTNIPTTVTTANKLSATVATSVQDNSDNKDGRDSPPVSAIFSVIRGKSLKSWTIGRFDCTKIIVSGETDTPREGKKSRYSSDDKMSIQSIDKPASVYRLKQRFKVTLH